MCDDVVQGRMKLFNRNLLNDYIYIMFAPLL